MAPPKDTKLGKGYSYLFAIALTTLLASQSVKIEFKSSSDGATSFSIATQELDPKVLYPCSGLIAAILGLPTDTIALLFGKWLGGE